MSGTKRQRAIAKEVLKNEYTSTGSDERTLVSRLYPMTENICSRQIILWRWLAEVYFSTHTCHGLMRCKAPLYCPRKFKRIGHTRPVSECEHRLRSNSYRSGLEMFYTYDTWTFSDCEKPLNWMEITPKSKIKNRTSTRIFCAKHLRHSKGGGGGDL